MSDAKKIGRIRRLGARSNDGCGRLTGPQRRLSASGGRFGVATAVNGFGDSACGEAIAESGADSGVGWRGPMAQAVRGRRGPTKALRAASGTLAARHGGDGRARRDGRGSRLAGATPRRRCRSSRSGIGRVSGGRGAASGRAGRRAAAARSRFHGTRRLAWRERVQPAPGRSQTRSTRRSVQPARSTGPSRAVGTAAHNEKGPAEAEP